MERYINSVAKNAGFILISGGGYLLIQTVNAAKHSLADYLIFKRQIAYRLQPSTFLTGFLFMFGIGIILIKSTIISACSISGTTPYCTINGF